MSAVTRLSAQGLPVMTSRFPKALAVVVLVLATALSGCNPFSSSGSEEAASTPGASASAGLDPRYEEGAFGAWSASLHTDAQDSQTWKEGSRAANIQAWVDEDGETAVFAYSPSAYLYASTLTAVNMGDGSTRWTVDLKDHRHGQFDQEDIYLAVGDLDVHCLPVSVQNHVVCDNVGLIDMRDGAVTEIPETTDFMGIGSGEAQDVVVGNLGKSVNPQAAAAWSVAGAQLWRRDDLVLDHSAVGGAWAVARRSGSQTSYEVISLTDGATLSSLDLPAGASVGNSIAFASTEGVVTAEIVSEEAPQTQYRMEPLNPDGALIRVLSDNAMSPRSSQVGLRSWPEEAPAEPMTPEAAVAWVEHDTGRFKVQDGDWFNADAASNTVTRVTSPAAPLPGTDELGLVGDDVIIHGTGSLTAYTTAQARPVWNLDLTSADPGGQYVNWVVRGGGRLFLAQYGGSDNSHASVALIAPGTPSSSGGAQGGASGASDGGIVLGESTAAPGSSSATSSAPPSSGGGGQAEAGSQPEGTPVQVPGSAPDSGSVPSIGVSQPAGAAVVGLQAFADDLAAGNFDKIREYCWTMSSSTKDRQYFSREARAAVLAALSGPGTALPGGGAQWQSPAGVVTASAEELGSPYACPVYRPGGVMDPVTDDDARLLLTRVVGVASGTPFRSGDDGHYTLVCTGGDWDPAGTGPAAAPMAARSGPTDGDVAAMRTMLNGTMKVTWGRTDGAGRYFVVTGSIGTARVTVRQDTSTGAVCVGDLS